MSEAMAKRISKKLAKVARKCKCGETRSEIVEKFNPTMAGFEIKVLCKACKDVLQTGFVQKWK